MSYIATEHWRNECEAAFVLRTWKTGAERLMYVERIGRKRGKAAGEELRASIMHRLKCRKEGIPIPPYPRGFMSDADAEEWRHDYAAFVEKRP